MKKLFLPLALLSLSACAQDSAQQTLTADQIAAQQAMLQAAGDQLAARLLQDPTLAMWYNDASDEDVKKFDALCVQFAAMNMMVYGQYAGGYSQLFNALTELTNSTHWSAQISFLSQGLAQQLRAQAAAAQAQANADDDGYDDED